MLVRPFIVAIDGPAGSGKGTVGTSLARYFGWKFLDTGLLYRAVARKLIAAYGERAVDKAVQIASELSEDDLRQAGLRSPDVSAMSSKIAAMQEVRDHLLKWQRNFARNCNGAVLDGRDIASVVFPDADVKLFLTASPKKRAERRHAELMARGDTTTLDRVYRDLLQRDKRDQARTHAPLIQTKDAIVIDTTDKSIKESVEAAIQVVEKAMCGS